MKPTRLSEGPGGFSARRGGAWGASALLVLALSGTASAASAEGDGILQALRLRGLTARPAALLMSGQTGGEVPLAHLALPLPGSGSESVVAVILEIGLEALASGGEGDLRAEVYIYATDSKGAPRGSITQVFNAPARRLEGEGAASAARFLGHLELPAGSYDLRVLVVGDRPDLFGLLRAPLQVPDFSGTAPALLPPLIVEESAEGWLLVKEAPHGRHRGDPLEALDLPRWPSVRPVLPAGWEGELLVLGRNLGPLPGDLSGRLQSSAEAPVGTSPLVSATLAAPIWDLESWRLAIRLEPTASGLARWSWDSSVEGVAVPPPREVWLVDTRDAEETMGQPWPRLLDPAAVAERVAMEELSSGNRQSSQEAVKKLKEKDLAKVRERFPGILLKMAEGRRSQAMGEILELEGAIVTGRSLPAVESLREAELAVLGPVAEEAPESLVPVVWFYLDLFERYLRDRELLLAAHARLLVRRLIDLFVQSTRGESARGLAADLLAAFGGSLQVLNLSTESESAFRQAVDLDPGHEIALRGLALSHEGARQDEAAVGYLENLVERVPGDAEACLRLGMIHLRNGRKSAGESALRSCVERQQPAWALAVAYEELALLLGREGRWKESSELLSEGSGRLPGEPRLRLLRGYALDRLQQPGAARSVLSAVAPEGGSPEAKMSPRFRYGRWPVELFSGFRSRLEPQVDRRRPILSEALAEVPSGGPS